VVLLSFGDKQKRFFPSKIKKYLEFKKRLLNILRLGGKMCSLSNTKVTLPKVH
jgi:hypothetical protein